MNDYRLISHSVSLIEIVELYNIVVGSCFVIYGLPKNYGTLVMK